MQDSPVIILQPLNTPYINSKSMLRQWRGGKCGVERDGSARAQPAGLRLLSQLTVNVPGHFHHRPLRKEDIPPLRVPPQHDQDHKLVLLTDVDCSFPTPINKRFLAVDVL